MVILPLLYSASSFGLPWEKTIDTFLTLEGAPYLQKKSLYLNSVSDIPHPNFFTIDLPRIRLADYEKWFQVETELDSFIYQGQPRLKTIVSWSSKRIRERSIMHQDSY